MEQRGGLQEVDWTATGTRLHVLHRTLRAFTSPAPMSAAHLSIHITTNRLASRMRVHELTLSKRVTE